MKKAPTLDHWSFFKGYLQIRIPLKMPNLACMRCKLGLSQKSIHTSTTSRGW